MQNVDLAPVLSDTLLGIDAFAEDPKLKSAHLHNALSALHEALGADSWVGLYFYDKGELILGPFQGSMACERIAIGKGVVGESFAKGETMTVKDVTAWPNYICCDSRAKSEICVPMEKEGHVFAILDIDLPYVHAYEANEKALFEQVARALCRFC